VAVGCYYGDLICVVECQVGVYEDEEVRYGFREGKRGFEEGPGVGIRVEDND